MNGYLKLTLTSKFFHARLGYKAFTVYTLKLCDGDHELVSWESSRKKGDLKLYKKAIKIANKLNKKYNFYVPIEMKV